MGRKTYLEVSAMVFTVVAVAHACRVLLGADVVIGGVMIPQWVSIVGAILAGFLAYAGFSNR